jgi:VWFA-related protein
LLLVIALADISGRLHSQTPAPPPAVTTPTIKVSTRLVVVDVIVSNRKGEPINGLPVSQFKISEGGVPQKIRSFEEHQGMAIVQNKLPAMPSNVFTNIPSVKAPDGLDVLLIDSLNTEPRDQASLRQNLLKYLKGIAPGSQIAVFTLGSRLRLVHGFTTDVSGLALAIGDKKSGTVPESSRLYTTAFQKDTEKELVEMMTRNQTSPVGIDALMQFQTDETGRIQQSRTAVTLQALQQLCRYLSQVPGRKNLIWFADSFPISYLPDPNQSLRRNLADQETAAMLTADQVAVYPVSTQGLIVDSQYDTGTFNPDSMQQQNQERSTQEIAMQTLADQTGGKAFFNTNGFSDALNKVLRDGSKYYTIAYKPMNESMHGEYRTIKVEVNNCRCRLAYRRGYYAREPISVEGEKAQDPLVPLIAFGMPDFDQITYKISVAPQKDTSESPQRVSSTENKAPLRRCAVDFSITTNDLRFQATADGIRHAKIRIMLIVYSRRGQPLQVASRIIDVAISPDDFKDSQQAGLRIHGEVEFPVGESHLRTGVYDYATGSVGTLTVPVSITDKQ